MIYTRAASRHRRVVVLVLVAMLVASVIVAMSPATPADARTRNEPAFTLTLIHNNDGESQVFPTGDFGGMARFATLAKQLHAEGRGLAVGETRSEWALSDRGSIMVTSGDNFLAGPEFNASLEKGVPFYDSIALGSLPYDALVLGNHDFDFGPDVTAEFISGFYPLPAPRPPRGAIVTAIESIFRMTSTMTSSNEVVFLSANLDVSGEPALAALKRQGRLASSKIAVTGGQLVGIIGITTPNLPFISSPRNVKVDPNVLGIVQAEVDRMQRLRVPIIVFVSHLQNIQEDVALISELRGVDVAIAGGGDELLASPDDLLIPGDEGLVYDTYPIIATDADGRQVPVVTTPGDYKYVGNLVVNFDRAGNVIGVDDGASGPKRVSSIAPDAVPEDPFIVSQVVEPIADYVAELATPIGTTEVQLEGRRNPGIRTQETNLGNLMADSLKWQAEQLAAAFGAPAPDVAFQNGGGIRNNDLRPATVPAPFTRLDTFDIAPFSNFVVIVPGISRDTLKAILENAYSRVEFADGRFGQISGLSVVVDLAETARDPSDPAGTPGSRVRSAILDDGTVIVADGAVVPGPAINVATIDFLANGGDQYPYDGAPFVRLGATYQQALANYVRDGLSGLISAADYPEVPLNGGSRVVILNRP